MQLKDFVKAGVHFGHKTSRWSPKMAPFIWGAKNKIHLIDVSKTALLLDRAGKFLQEVSSEGKDILFVGTKKAAISTIERIGKELNLPIVTNRWIGGTLSNYNQIKKAITKLAHLKDVVKKSNSYYTKKELSTLQKEIGRLEKNVGGITNLKYPPAAIVVVDAKRERAAIKEALTMNVPIISMVDTNTDPTGINFVIPSNDDASKAIDLVLTSLSKYISKGKEAFAKAQEVAAKPKATVKKAAASAQEKPAEKVEKKASPKEDAKEAPKKAAPKKVTAKPAAKKVETKAATKTTAKSTAKKTVKKTDK